MTVRTVARDRRRLDRSRKRVSVRYGRDRAHVLGYTIDLGEKGMFLQGNQLFPPETVLQVELDLPEGRRSVMAIVRWVKEVPAAFRRSLRGGMGIEILSER